MDGGNSAARTFGVEEAPTRVEESTGGMFDVVTNAIKENLGGNVFLYTGEVQIY